MKLPGILHRPPRSLLENERTEPRKRSPLGVRKLPKKSLNRSLCFMTCYCVLFFVIHADDGKNRERKSLATLLDELQDPDRNVRITAEAIMFETYNETVSQLLRIASKDGPLYEGRGSRTLAISVLGYLRAESAVPFLIKNLTFNPDVEATMEKFSGPPCVQSLVAIGKPASLAAVIELPKTTTDEKRTRLLLRVVKAVEGAEVGEFMLKRALETAETEENKLAYSQALLIFGNIQVFGLDE